MAGAKAKFDLKIMDNIKVNALINYKKK